jgi:hypothetical protein
MQDKGFWRYCDQVLRSTAALCGEIAFRIYSYYYANGSLGVA